jgi:hypothetical protein
MILLRTVAAVLLLALQEAPQDWIRQLGSEDPRVRDRAGARLLEDGEKSRALLEKAAEDKDAEISQRARILVSRLNARKVLPTSTGELGKSGGFWIGREALPLLADENNVPKSMKALLHDEAEATFAMVRVEGRGARLMDIVTARTAALTEEQAERYGYLILDAPELQPKLFRHCAHGCMDAQMTVNDQRVIWDFGWEYVVVPFGEWKQASDSRPGDLFRSWPDLRSASVVFVAPSDSGKALEKAFLEALPHPKRDVRLAATVALARYYTLAAVDGILRRLEDSDAAVAEAALETLKTIALPPQGSPAELREWWLKLPETERKDQLMKRNLERPSPPGGVNRGQGRGR